MIILGRYPKEFLSSRPALSERHSRAEGLSKKESLWLILWTLHSGGSRAAPTLIIL